MPKKTLLNNVFSPLLFLFVFMQCKTAPVQGDAVKIMTYNVLKYGDDCQGPAGQLHAYLRTIIDYTKPDILGLVKVEAIQSNHVKEGKAPVGFIDSVLLYALNTTQHDKYACCPFTNAARDDSQNLLFYNKQKFGFASYVTLVADISDINMYKLYYLDAALSRTHDTAFIYFVLVHTASGDESGDRDRQMTELMSALKTRFSILPDLIVMGDFNLRNTNEAGYQVLADNAEKNYRFFDPPFSLDKEVSYPANWDKHPERFASFLTTSTRRQKDVPNECGTGGGAKDWYDHILLSPSLANRQGFYHYIPHSYGTVGNDGDRIDKSVNDQPIQSGKKELVDALFQMSNKYPVTLELNIGGQR
jgi:endonuclease/exonuclease/phosphatase family metal-dependent hydrolase